MTFIQQLFKYGKLFSLFLSTIISIQTLKSNEDLPIKVAQRYKKIVVTITSYNNARWYKQNLNSVIMQRYRNFRVIYIDDASTDGTPHLVEEYIKNHKLQKKILLIKNETWKSQTANHYTIGHLCEDDEIIVNLDGDDWFRDRHVLETINQAYFDPNIWLTYGAPIFFPERKINFRAIPKTILEEGSFRKSHNSPGAIMYWNWWHPRTYYAWLFKQLKLQDLLIESSFEPLTPSPDSAIMYPLLEMAGLHSHFIARPMYVWNMKNPLSQWIVSGPKQLAINAKVRSWKPYEKLQAPVISPQRQYQNKTADVLIIYTSTRGELKHFIQSTLSSVSNLRNIYVIMESNTNTITQQVASLFPQIIVKEVTAQKNFSAVLQELKPMLAEHIVLADTSQPFRETFNVSMAIEQLEKTFAFACTIQPQNNPTLLTLPKHTTIGEIIHAWQFKNADGLWKKPFTNHLTMYRSKDLFTHCQGIKLPTVSDFIKFWEAKNNITDESIALGICY